MKRRPLRPDPSTPPIDLPRLEPALELMRALWTVNHELERLSMRMTQSLGITAQQRMVLRIVGRFPGITAGRLSALLCVDGATVSTTLARLERRGLLRRERDPRDLRRVAVGLTPAGRALDGPTTGTVEAAVTAVLARTPRAKLSATHAVLASLAEAMHDEEGPTRPRRKRAPTGAASRAARAR